MAATRLGDVTRRWRASLDALLQQQSDDTVNKFLRYSRLMNALHRQKRRVSSSGQFRELHLCAATTMGALVQPHVLSNVVGDCRDGSGKMLEFLGLMVEEFCGERLSLADYVPIRSIIIIITLL